MPLYNQETQESLQGYILSRSSFTNYSYCIHLCAHDAHSEAPHIALLELSGYLTHHHPIQGTTT